MSQKFSFNNLGNRVALASGFQVRNGAGFYSGTVFPKSGTAGTTVRDGSGAPAGSLYMDTGSKVLFVNEGTNVSPYWTPTSITQRGLLGWYSDFTTGGNDVSGLGTLGVPIADTNTASTLLGSGLRLHGQGLSEVDSGMTVALSDQGAIATLVTTDEDAHLTCLSVGQGTVPVFQPDQNGTIVLDVNVAYTSLTACAGFVGFGGDATAALDPLMTYSGTTISFAATQADDIAGLTWSSEMGDNDRWYAPHDKGNANATILTTATGVDTGVDAVAGVYQRLRVEVDADGVVRVFIAKALISTFSACLDADEEITPLVYIEDSTTSTKSMTLKHFYAYGKRAA